MYRIRILVMNDIFIKMSTLSSTAYTDISNTIIEQSVSVRTHSFSIARSQVASHTNVSVSGVRELDVSLRGCKLDAV